MLLCVLCHGFLTVTILINGHIMVSNVYYLCRTKRTAQFGVICIHIAHFKNNSILLDNLEGKVLSVYIDLRHINIQ